MTMSHSQHDSNFKEIKPSSLRYLSSLSSEILLICVLNIDKKLIRKNIYQNSCQRYIKIK